MRPIITKLLAAVIFAGSIYGAMFIIGSKKKVKPVSNSTLPVAKFMEVKNALVPIQIVESGRISAVHKIDLYSEVQGVMLNQGKSFKPGTKFAKGEILVQINSADFHANLLAQKSVLQNLLTSILPDLKLDYPNSYPQWDAYVKNFSLESPIKPLPKPENDKEKFFLTGKNIYTTYYNTKNMELVYAKYTLRAPFDGILTESLVNPGSLIRNGQKLGEFIHPNEYELELSIGKALVNKLEVGNKVSITNPENENQKWQGEINRINAKVNPSTQSVQVFISLSGSHLKEGMYLEAALEGQEILNAIEIPRTNLVDDDQIYKISKDSTLQLIPVHVVHKTRNTAILQAVPEGIHILTHPIPGAYSGMKVILKK